MVYLNVESDMDTIMDYIIDPVVMFLWTEDHQAGCDSDCTSL